MPKARFELSVIGLMLSIFIKRYTVRYFTGSRTYGCTETEGVKMLQDRSVELRYRNRLKLNEPLRSAYRLDYELMVNKIKTYLEGDSAIRYYRCTQTSSSQIKRNVPRMIRPWRMRQTNLANNLRPHMQGGDSIGPFTIGQCRPIRLS